MNMNIMMIMNNNNDHKYKQCNDNNQYNQCNDDHEYNDYNDEHKLLEEQILYDNDDHGFERSEFIIAEGSLKRLGVLVCPPKGFLWRTPNHTQLLKFFFISKI